MKILISNDDGYLAPGLLALYEALKDVAQVEVIAPEVNNSAKSNALTLHSPLYVRQGENGFRYVNGTPADCVKLAIDKVLHQKPDICLSGINHGANHSINIIYSGTMSAAIEASIENIPSIGFSLMDYSLEADFTGAKKYARMIVEKVLSKKADKHLCLNVNFPKGDVELIKGVKVCRQAYAKYEEDFEERKDPSGKKYYWLTGIFQNLEKSKDTDVWALENNYVSVVPVQYDLTNHLLKNKIEKDYTWKS
jgi:5'-nucleotidase